MKILLSLLLSIITNVIFSQELISVSGNSYSATNGSTSYSIGEVFIFGNGKNYNEGFHQPKLEIVTGITTKTIYHFKLFPNPATNSITFSPLNQSSRYNIVLTSSKGEKLTHLQNVKGKIHIDLSTYEAGLYIFQISNQDKTQSFQVIKR